MPLDIFGRSSVSRLFNFSSTQIIQPTINLDLPTPNPHFFSSPISGDLDSDPEASGTHKVVDQVEVKKAERRIWGLFVMRISHFTGLHPVRAPFFCTEEQCVKLSLSQRLSVLDITMWSLNFLTCVNHIFLRFIRPGILNIWLEMDSVYLLRECIISFYPLGILLISLTNSAGLDRLLHLISQTKREISESNNNQRIRRWRILMIALNGLFMTAFVANFAIILLHNILNDEIDSTLFPNGRQANSLTAICFSNFTSTLECFDDAYYEIMAFGVGELPRIFIMMISIELGFLFKENASLVAGKRLTTDRLNDFHENFQKSTSILSQLESTFNKLILFAVCFTILMMTLNFHVVLQYLTSIHQGNQSNIGNKALAIVLNVDWPDSGVNGEIHSMCHVVLLVEAANFCLKLSWTLGFIVACVWCNEKSRSALSHLLNHLALGDAKPIKDQLVQKLQDYSWGITMGKFMRMERTVLITMVSVAFTTVIVWLQIVSVKS